MNKIVYNLSLATFVAILSGCAASDIDNFARKYSPDNVQRMALRSLSNDSAKKFEKKFNDPVLAKAFSKYYDKKGYAFDYEPNKFHIRKVLVNFSDNVYMKQANDYIEQLPTENEFTKLYKETILKRGNHYKVLTGSFNKKLIELMTNRKMPRFSPQKKLYLKWNTFPAIAEFDNNGKLVSLMVGNYTTEAAYGMYKNPEVQSEIMQNILLFSGNELNKVRLNVTSSMWKENTIESK